MSRLVRLTLSLLVLLLTMPPASLSYEDPPDFSVTVSGPRGSVDCERTVTLTARVIDLTAGEPIKGQNVRWALDKGSPKDRLSPRVSRTDAQGKARAELFIGQALGDRRVSGQVAGSRGRVTIDVTCVLPTPTPRPTPRATPRPTARTTPRPTRRPTPRPTRRPQASPSVSPSPDVTALEKPVLRLGYRTPDLAGRAPFLIADARGLFADAGFESVSLVEAADGVAALQDGSVDMAVVDVPSLAAALQAGVPLRIVAGFRNERPMTIAVAPGVETAADLAGRRVVLGPANDASGDEAVLAALAESGWDLAGVDIRVAAVEGGPDAWAQGLLSGDVALAPIANGNRLDLARAGASLVVDRLDPGGDMLVVLDDLATAAPGTVAAFQGAFVGALQALTVPATDDELFAVAQAAGIETPIGVQAGWANDLDEFAPWDGGVGLLDEGGGVGALVDLLTSVNGAPPALDQLILVDGLHAAQAAAGLEPNPVFPAASPTPSASPSPSASPNPAASPSPSASPSPGV